MRTPTLLRPLGLDAAVVLAAVVAAPSATGGGATTVSVVDNSFSPATKSVSQGTSTWRTFRTDATAASGLFNPAQNGTYELRARTSNTSASKESGWSPTISRQIS